MLKRKFAYRQAVVKTNKHPHLNKGQIVEIVGETVSEYKIRINETGVIFTLEKKDLIVNQS